MNQQALRRLALDASMFAHGVDATVTVPSGAPIVTRAIWQAGLEEAMPVGRDFQRRDPRRILALPLADVPDVPRGTVIVAPLPGTATTRTWKVENVERLEAEQIRVIVAPSP
jgi:hypothetical protein